MRFGRPGRNNNNNTLATTTRQPPGGIICWFSAITKYYNIRCLLFRRRHGGEQKGVRVHTEQDNRRPAERVVPEFKLRRRERSRGQFQSHGIAVRAGAPQ